MSLMQSDLRRAGLEKVDFGWGNAIYAGTAKAIPELVSFYIPFTNKKGEDGIVVPFCLPSPAVERFYKELEGMLKGQLLASFFTKIIPYHNGFITLFSIHRREPELIKPAKPTPHEFKLLSDIDDQEGLRFHIPLIQLYRHNPSVQGKDPVKVIREAIAKTLVFYYPFAGRLREGHNRKLMVECTGEGILFIEADADVTLEQFGDPLQPPFPCLEELLFDVPGSSGVLNCPLLLIQVSRLKCGGFLFALRLNHTMSDGQGLVQFMAAVAEIARGANAPSVPPVWERHVLSATDPPRVTCRHRAYEEVAGSTSSILTQDHLVHRSFFFSPSDITALRRLVPPHLSHCSSFEILTACLWICRTIALQPDPNEEMRIICLVNAREKFNPPLLPRGYYGNGFGLLAAVATAGELSRKPIGYALELVRKAKADMIEEYLRSTASLMVSKGRPLFTVPGTYIVSDLRRAGLEKVDFGWGNAIYGGTAKAIPELASFYIPFTNKKGEDGIVVPFCLPSPAVERFYKELEGMLKGQLVS
ncbi:benzyl alcohol O-benzoyltransferase-like [Populus alba x Populus x berolinensis]|nr:benzyl alcohol O-benzoyltransferase-like [Populus alba x Populus x berolinensis]